MADILLATSDWHLGDRGRRDRSRRESIQRTIEAACDLRVKALVLLGDIFEHITFGMDELERANEPFLRRLVKPLAERQIPWIQLNGNHDPNHQAEVVHYLAACGVYNPTFLTPDPKRRQPTLGVWYLEHGHGFDAMCSAPVLSQLATGATWVWRQTVVRAWPTVPEAWANPVGWFLPSKSDGRATAVRDKAMAWAHTHVEPEGYPRTTHLLCGHTHVWDHFADEDGSFLYVNTGACADDAPFSCVLFTPDGDATVLR